jgi:hypothetical protein
LAKGHRQLLIILSSKKKKGAYFIGKALWAKGHRQLLIMLKEHLKRTGENLDIDIFGNGPDLELIKAEVFSFFFNPVFWGGAAKTYRGDQGGGEQREDQLPKLTTLYPKP